MHALETFELVLSLLAIVVALYWLALKLRLPPAAALLVGGGALAFLPGLPSVSLDPGLALILFLPPLLVDGAYSTALGRFRRHLPGILSLAVGAVVFTTFVVGVVAHWIVPDLPWAACFALGAIVSPPDAISARAVLKGLSLPRRLNALLEGGEPAQRRHRPDPVPLRRRRDDDRHVQRRAGAAELRPCGDRRRDRRRRGRSIVDVHRQTNARPDFAGGDDGAAWMGGVSRGRSTARLGCDRRSHCGDWCSAGSSTLFSRHRRGSSVARSSASSSSFSKRWCSS